MSPQIRSFLPCLRKPAPVGVFLGILSCAALMSAPALADSADAYVVGVLTERIEVTSNGSAYVNTNGFANLVADVRIIVDTGSVGRVKSWKLWLGLQGEHSDTLWFPNYGASKAYAWNKRPRSVDRTERLSVPSGVWSGYVKARCNALADSLRAQGLGNTAIFSQDRTIELAVRTSFSVDTTGAGQGNILIEGSGGWDGHEKVDLVCKKWTGAAVPQASGSITTVPAEVVDTSLAITETSGLNGVCKIRLKGAIATDHLNIDVSFRYKDKAGHESQVWTVNTGEAKFAVFSHSYDVPNGAGPETGSVRMVGVSRDFESAWVDYAMDCVEGGPNTLTSNDPPKLTIKSVEAEGKKMVAGQICPERLRLVGEVEGRGNFSGFAAFVATGGAFWMSPPQAYDLEPGETQLLVGYYPLNWAGGVVKVTGQPIEGERTFDFRATNANNAVIASVTRKHMFTCVPPKRSPAVGGSASDFGVQPRQPAAPTAAPRLQQTQPVSPTPQVILPRRQLKQAN